MNLIIAGGGTGGHIFGGVAIAEEFLAQSKGNHVLFVGSSVGLETTLVPKAGYNLVTLKLGRLVGQGLAQKILTLFQIPMALLKCMFILKKHKANIVIGVGGFAAGPCIVAARLLGIPCGILEQNSVPGLTNKISARFAHHIFTAFDAVPAGFKKEKCIYTGNPARSQLKPSQKNDQSSGAVFTIFAFGGSQGATGINKLLTEAVPLLTAQGLKFNLIHQTGPRDLDWVKAAYSAYPHCIAHAFIDNMQSMYDKASVVLCRAGSGTITELAATGNAAIFIPFPQAAGNHQEINAAQVQVVGGALLLRQQDTTAEILTKTLTDLAQNPDKITKMQQKIRTFHKPLAAHRIVEVMKTRALQS